MSAPQFVKRAQRFAAQQAATELADARRERFLRALDAADVEVTDAEAQFLDDSLKVMDRQALGASYWWTPAWRAAVDRMISKYPDINS